MFVATRNAGAMVTKLLTSPTASGSPATATFVSCWIRSSLVRLPGFITALIAKAGGGGSHAVIHRRARYFKARGEGQKAGPVVGARAAGVASPYAASIGPAGRGECL